MKMRKTAALFLSLALACSVNATAFAADADSTTVTEDGKSAEIGVTGTYQAGTPGASVYKVDIAWTNLNFTYTAGSAGEWNPNTHTYNGSSEGSWGSQSGTITVTNHSNAMVEAIPVYKAAEGYESANMTFGSAGLELQSADNHRGQDGAGQETTGTITVTPGGTLPEDTNGDIIGTITVTISASK